MKSFAVVGLMLIVVVACGGMVEPTAPACELEGGAVPCSSSTVYVFTPAPGGGTLGDECSTVGCPSGARCAVVGELGTRYGVCR